MQIAQALYVLSPDQFTDGRIGVTKQFNTLVISK